MRHGSGLLVGASVGFVAILLTSCGLGTDPRPPQLTHPTGDDVVFLVLGGRPHGVATATNGRFAISQIDGHQVTFGVIADGSQAFTSSASVGNTPAHVAINRAGTRAYTADQYGNTLSVVDVSTGDPLATVPLGGNGFNLLVSSTGQRVYVTTGNGLLHIIDAASNTSLEAIEVGAAANGLALHEPSGTLYVSSRDAARITAIDTDELAVIRMYSVSGSPQRIAISADNSELYIASEAVGLEILDVANGERTIVQAVEGAAVGLAQSPDAEEIWVTHPPLGLVTVVDRVSRVVKRTDEIGSSPRNVAFDLTGATAIISDEANRVYFVR